jgi:hypothetical protein
MLKDTDFKTLNDKADILSGLHKNAADNVKRLSKEIAAKFRIKNALKEDLHIIKSIYKNMKNEALVVSLREFKIVTDKVAELTKMFSDTDNSIKSLLEDLLRTKRLIASAEKELDKVSKEINSFGKVKKFSRTSKKNK